MSEELQEYIVNHRYQTVFWYKRPGLTRELHSLAD